MRINKTIALVTGADGGIGSAFVAELLKRGAGKVYVATRSVAAPATSIDTALLPPPRITPAELVGDALDAIEAGKSEEIVAGALSQKAFVAITTDREAFQARLSTQLPQVTV